MDLITLLIFVLSLFLTCDAAVTKDPKFHLTSQPNWDMVIANLSADAGKDFPYAEYVSRNDPSEHNHLHKRTQFLSIPNSPVSGE